MHDHQAQISGVTAAGSGLLWLAGHFGAIEAGAQFILTLVTIGAMTWAGLANFAKWRHYQRLREQDDDNDMGV